MELKDLISAEMDKLTLEDYKYITQISNKKFFDFYPKIGTKQWKNMYVSGNSKLIVEAEEILKWFHDYSR